MRNALESQQLARNVRDSPDGRREGLAERVTILEAVLPRLDQTESERQVLSSIVSSLLQGEVAHAIDEHHGAQTCHECDVVTRKSAGHRIGAMIRSLHYR